MSARDQFSRAVCEAADAMYAVLISAREFLSVERNAYADGAMLDDGTFTADDRQVLDDYDALLLQIEAAIGKAERL